ncbi:MAG: endonuclease/exonuclease/phosphatase family protein [Clostridia bacterium]|nr:endonuclease/exonuclease/phosphatase family protein [Clostridia bacterium]
MIKVITFNLRCANDVDGHSIDERAPRLKKVLAPLDADLIGFQEVVPRWMEHLEKEYGEEYEIFNKYRAAHNKEATPMMWKKSRFDCLDKGYFWLSDTPDMESKGWDSIGCWRICLWAKLYDKVDGNELVFFNTHYGFGDFCQVSSGKLILDHIKAMNVDAAFVTADFNMYPGSAGYKKLTEELVDCNAATLNYNGCTYHGYHPENHVNGRPIDFCFVTPNTVTPVSTTLLDQNFDGKYPSDHFGFLFELELHKNLKLMSFNVQNNGAPVSPVDRARMLRSIIRKYDADVVGLQEVTPDFVERLEKIGRYNISLKYRLEEQKEATPILWNKEKFDLIHEEFFWLSETPDVPGKGFGGHYVRIATLVVLQFKGSARRICYVNTHFDFGAENHVASAKLIKEKVAPYGDMPIFVTADFNMQIGSEGYVAMRESFKDVRWEVAPRDFTPTYNNLGHDMCAPQIIDFVFTNGVKVTPKSYKVIDEMPKGEYVSDHNGIFATFILD